jgi:hypothetical protein
MTHTKDEALKLLDVLKVKYSDVIYDTSPSLAAQFENGIAGIKQALAAQPAPVPLTPEQRRNLWVSATIELPSRENCYYRGLVDAEAYHGITAAPEKGQP